MMNVLIKRIFNVSSIFLIATTILASSTYAASTTISKTMTTDVKLFNTTSFIGTGAAQTLKCYANSSATSGDCYITRGSDFYRSTDVGNGRPSTSQITVILQKGYVYNLSARVSIASKIGDKVTAVISD